MRIVIYPFLSQQNKETGRFLLKTCAACKQLRFLMSKMLEEGWDAHILLPLPAQCQDIDGFSGFRRRVYMPISNPVNRVHWNTQTLKDMFDGADIALCHHQHMAIPLRALFPELKIVQMCTVLPASSLFHAAWDSADLVIAQGAHMASRIRFLTSTEVRVWSLAYDETDAPTPKAKTNDVLFVQRCSATNYTHHEEFVEAMAEAPYRVLYTDVTRYLRKLRPNLLYTESSTYKEALETSKVAVALNDNWYGGLAIREAILGGCVPVVLRAPCYEELVGKDWPFFVESLSSKHIRDAVERALTNSVANVLLLAVQRRVAAESFQKAWPKVKEDLCSLL